MRRSSLAAELSAELLGTFILILIGLSVTAQAVLSGGPGGQALTIALGWGIALLGAIHVAGGISGAHVNPAVTVALALRRGFPWAKVLPYCLAQLLGALLGAAVVGWIFRPALSRLDPARTARTLRAFALVPGSSDGAPAAISHVSAFLILAVASAAFLLLILAVTDARNTAPGSNLAPLVLGLVVAGLILAFDPSAGYSFNPARDLGPRLVAFVLGWGSAFSDQSGTLFAWVPLVAPVAGGIVGAYAYDLAVGNFLPAAEPEFAELDLEVEP